MLHYVHQPVANCVCEPFGAGQAEHSGVLIRASSLKKAEILQLETRMMRDWTKTANNEQKVELFLGFHQVNSVDAHPSFQVERDPLVVKEGRRLWLFCSSYWGLNEEVITNYFFMSSMFFNLSNDLSAKSCQKITTCHSLGEFERNDQFISALFPVESSPPSGYTWKILQMKMRKKICCDCVPLKHSWQLVVRSQIYRSYQLISHCWEFPQRTVQDLCRRKGWDFTLGISSGMCRHTESRISQEADSSPGGTAEVFAC